eukprot:c28347_g1_i1 orf=791-4057(+)
MNITEKLQDLVEEAKRRTILFVICIASLAYALSLTGSSLLSNVPIATLIIVLLRYLSFELEIQKRVPAIHIPSHLSHLLRHQIHADDPHLQSPPVSTRWRRKIDSAVVEVAIDDFTRHIVKEYVTDLWYSFLTPDQDVPEQLRMLINDVIGEIAQRIKRINLINLLTRDVVNLVGSHLDLFRQAKSTIGTRYFGTLSSEERDEKVKRVLLDKGLLHPALLSPEFECKVLQRLMSGVVAILLRPQDADCALMRCLARELLACAILLPIMNCASPSVINEIIEQAMISSKVTTEAKKNERIEVGESLGGRSSKRNISQSYDVKNNSSLTKSLSAECLRINTQKAPESELWHPGASSKVSRPAGCTKQGDWAKVLDALSERREKTLAPENLDNLWTKGRNYKKREFKRLAKASQAASLLMSRKNDHLLRLSFEKQGVSLKEGILKSSEVPQAYMVGKPLAIEPSIVTKQFSDRQKMNKSSQPSGEGSNSVLQGCVHGGIKQVATDNSRSTELEVSRHPLDFSSEDAATKIQRQDPSGSVSQHYHPRSLSTGVEGWQRLERLSANRDSSIYYWDAPAHISPGGSSSDQAPGWPSDLLMTSGQGLPIRTAASKLNCWVVGAHLEKAGSKSFAVYSIAVTDSDNKTWFVDRRFRNFEQLHRRLRDLPQYNLQLPPKRFLSSSLSDSFVRDRCILLDKYLKDLLSIPSIAELHEVWDFLSITSKNYAFSKSPSVMKTLVVNVDDAMDDMFRQLKGVSDGIFRRVSGPPLASSDGASTSTHDEVSKAVYPSETAPFHNISWVEGGMSGHHSDDEYGGLPEVPMDEQSLFGKGDGWHSDSELHAERYPLDSSSCVALQKRSPDIDGNDQQFERRLEGVGSDGFSPEGSMVDSDIFEDELPVPPEWTPPKLTVPLLNLVDSIFQLQGRGWIRRQVFWMAKQILQLIVGDAIDDWLVAQIRELRREDVVASLIRLVQEVMWPDGVIVDKNQQTASSSTSGRGVDRTTQKGTDQSMFFELQLEATRRASVVHEILVEGAPTALVSLIGKRQYTRCAKDIYYFLQSTVCLKQLAYSLLEVLLNATFPELNSLVLDVRQGII